MRLLGVPGINRLIAPNMQPKSAAKSLDGLRFQGSSQADIDKMSQAAAEAAFHFFNLPTYLDTWKTLIASVATLAGANPKYQLGADQLQQVEQPTLFVWGENDPFGGLDVARQVVHVMPQAQLYEMQTGHLPFLDQPEACGRPVSEFLAQHHEIQQKNF